MKVTVSRTLLPVPYFLIILVYYSKAAKKTFPVEKVPLTIRSATYNFLRSINLTSSLQLYPFSPTYTDSKSNSAGTYRRHFYIRRRRLRLPACDKGVANTCAYSELQAALPNPLVIMMSHSFQSVFSSDVSYHRLWFSVSM